MKLDYSPNWSNCLTAPFRYTTQFSSCSPLLDISSILWAVLIAVPANTELQLQSDDFSHFHIHSVYSHRPTELELGWKMWVVGSLVADFVNLLHLLRITFHNMLTAQSMLTVTGLAGLKNIWCCAFENGIIVSLFRYNINPIAILCGWWLQLLCSNCKRRCLFQSLCVGMQAYHLFTKFI